MKESIENIITGINIIFNKEKSFIPIKESEKFQNEDGIIFIKPEVCFASHKPLSKILEYFFKASDRYDISYNNIYVISGLYIYEKKIFAEIYKKIYEYAILDTALTPYLLSSLQNKIGYEYKRIIGGLALERSGFPKEKILETWKKNDIVKIDDNMYGTEFLFRNNKLFLINGFVPSQLSSYQMRNSKIILFTFKSTHPTQTLKKFFQGSINDTRRQNRSIRKYLYDMQDQYKIAPIFLSRNGIHMSENLSEGKRELEIFEKALLDGV